MSISLEAINAPWKVSNRVFSWVTHPVACLLFAFNGIPWKKNWLFYGLPILQKYRGSVMRFGDGLQLRSITRSNPLGINHPVFLATLHKNACLEVGNDFAMSGGSICAAEYVKIGNRVALGANSIIADTDFHPIELALRHQYPQKAKTAPVFIADDVFIGMNSVILKGVSIGQGSVVGAGSVVTKNVPPGVIVAGNPAHIIRELQLNAH